MVILKFITKSKEIKEKNEISRPSSFSEISIKKNYNIVNRLENHLTRTVPNHFRHWTLYRICESSLILIKFQQIYGSID